MADILEKKFTYQDYKNLDVEDNFWYELLNGELVKKSSPSPLHQRVSRNLLVALNTFIVGKKLGEVFYSPIDVFLDDYNVPQPDLVFVSDARKEIISDDGILGIPDMVIEIISPSSFKRDRVDKMKLYKKHQIPEFWLIDPNNTSVEIYTFQENDYDVFSLAVQSGTVQSKVLPEFTLEVSTLFT